MMNQITVMCEHAAKEYARIATEKTVLISIVEKNSPPIEFHENNNIVDIFRLFLNDLCVDIMDPKIPNKVLYEAPVQEDFSGLKEFIDKYKDINIVVHCAAGVSRSAGVAMAIGEYLGVETGIANSSNYDPNSVCYRCTQYELMGYRLGDGFKKKEDTLDVIL